VVKISIVTPSYNQAEFLTGTLQSIADQTYDNYEHVVMDAGSDDGSVDIIKQYADKLHYWCSEPDEGQSDAINKGVAHTTGELVAWINADDVLFPRCLEVVAKRYEAAKAGIITANVLWMDQDGIITRCINVPKQSEFFFWRGVWHASAPCILFTRELFDGIGGLDTSFRLSMDVDMWFKMMAHHPHIEHIKQYLGGFRLHDTSKSMISHKQDRPLGVNEETAAVHTAHGISKRKRDRWRTVYRVWRTLRLGYLRERLDLGNFRNLHWREAAEMLTESR